MALSHRALHPQLIKDMKGRIQDIEKPKGGPITEWIENKGAQLLQSRKGPFSAKDDCKKQRQINNGPRSDGPTAKGYRRREGRTNVDGRDVMYIMN